MTLNTLVLCDDRHPGFWDNRKEWNDDLWLEWEVLRIAAPDGDGPMGYRMLEEVISKTLNRPSIFVVTDAHYGADGLGGATLLRELQKTNKLIKGVVFSTQPHLLTEQKSEGSIIREVIDVLGEDRASGIRLWFENGIFPKNTAVNSAYIQMSGVIHALDNALLPIKLDIETLSSANPPITDEIYTDYFSVNDGYLTENCGRLNHGDIIKYFKDKINELKSVSSGKKIEVSISLFEETVIQTRNSQMNSNRRKFLSTDLKEVLMAGSVIVDKLRVLRNNIAVN